MQVNQVIVTGPQEVSLQSLPLEETNLLPNELLIETEYSFISAGTELAIYTAKDSEVYQKGSWCCYPFKSGYGNIGKVLAAGTEHQALTGKRVFTNGPHASAFRYETDGRYRMIAPVPEGLALEEAVAARMAMVSIASLDVSNPVYMRWVVVIGLGMVGNLAAQLFQLTGAHVIGVDPSPVRRKMAIDCGIPHAIGGTEEEIAAEVKRLTGGHMAHVTIDAVGASSICVQAVRLTAQGGEVIILGSPRTEQSGNLTEVFRASHLRWVTIKGALEWTLPADSVVEHAYTLKKRLTGIFRWIADGRLKLKPLITHVLPPTDIKKAYEGLLNEKETFVGVVLKWK